MKRLRLLGCLFVAAVGAGCGDDTATTDQGTAMDMTVTTGPDLRGAQADLAGGTDAATGGDASATGQTTMVMVGPGGANSFSPATATIHTGDTVMWTWDTGLHSVTSGTPNAPDGKFCSIPTDTAPSVATCTDAARAAHSPPFSYSHRFDTAGTFPYFCIIHGVAMTGTITVTAAQ